MRHIFSFLECPEHMKTEIYVEITFQTSAFALQSFFVSHLCFSSFGPGLMILLEISSSYFNFKVKSHLIILRVQNFRKNEDDNVTILLI